MKSDSAAQNQEVVRILKAMESDKAAYPADLLAARRSAFLKQVEQQAQVEVQEELTSQDHKIVQLLAALKSVETEYPSSLLAGRRSAFRNQILRVQPAGFWQRLRLALQSKMVQPVDAPRLSPVRALRTSLVVAGVLVALAGFLFYGNRSPLSRPAPVKHGISQAGALFGTTTPEVKKILCKPGFVPPLCLAREFDQSRDLTFQGNGSARPAVAKDTLPGYGEIHRAAYLNDGLYGPGASWVSHSKHSWIKIDLGKATTVNTVTFGRDRLGQMNDGDPGRFTISVALQDDVYADGNSTNDNVEYTRVYDSQQAGFDGEISGAETVVAQFVETRVRFVKLTFENAGTAIDEVEVFLVKTPPPADPTRATDRDPAWTATPLPTRTPRPTSTPLPTNTPPPTNTPIPTFTETPLPTDTVTPVPTDTLVPTDPPTVEPTSTPPPVDTPQPTDTSLPIDVTQVETTLLPEP